MSDRPKCKCFKSSARASDMTNFVAIGVRDHFEDLVQECGSCDEAVEFLFAASVLNMAAVVASHQCGDGAMSPAVVERTKEILSRISQSALSMVSEMDVHVIQEGSPIEGSTH